MSRSLDPGFERAPSVVTERCSPAAAAGSADPREPGIPWPENKTFAFSVFDDTDYATLENVRPVYSLLEDLGFRTTKSVWPLRGAEVPMVGGATCEDADYLSWLRELQSRGFEIGLHNVAYHTSRRADTVRGIERFRELFGHDPGTFANHVGCQESIYWGEARLTGAHAWLYRLARGFRRRPPFGGHIEDDPCFWGDICRQRVKYVRNFVYPEINTLKVCPVMPYHDPARPYVNYWFASSEGSNVDSFCATLSEAHQDRLEEEGGACIMYAHFSCGFADSGGLHRGFEDLMRRLSKKAGWFVPVGTLLDHLLAHRQRCDITPGERRMLERRWLLHKVRYGTS